MTMLVELDEGAPRGPAHAMLKLNECVMDFRMLFGIALRIGKFGRDGVSASPLRLTYK